MRLIIGTEPPHADITAIQRGLAADVPASIADAFDTNPFADHAVAVRDARLDVLAWLVANDQVDVKLAVPITDAGTPNPDSFCRSVWVSSL